MSRLSDKVAIVTGAPKGIGGGIATALAAAGARVAVNFPPTGKALNGSLGRSSTAGGEAIAVEADVFKAADVAPLFKEVTAVTISLSISFTAEKATALSICRNIGLPFGV